MKTAVSVALLQLCLSAAVSGNGANETSLTAELGDVVLLPCYSVGNETPSVTIWVKDGQEVLRGGGSSPSRASAGRRVTVLRDGSLNISGVAPGDEGSYLCNSTLPGRDTFQARVLLQVTSGPDNVSTSIGPVTALPNGTLVALQGSTVFFNCSGSSYPSQQLTWAFRGASLSNGSLASTSGSWLDFRIEDIQPSSQGVYSCWVKNTVSHQTVTKSTQLLVYYVPDRYAECTSVVAQNLSEVQLNCSWFGVYPTPMLRWEDGYSDREEHVYGRERTESLLVTLDRFKLSNGQTLRCMAEHPALAPGKEKLCSFTFRVSDRHPECMWARAQDPSQLQFMCSWSGVYPPPKLHWKWGNNDVSEVTNNLTVSLNHSQLSNGQTVKCVAEHLLLEQGKEKSCSFTLKPPYPEGDPLATAVETRNVTLTCTEIMSFPPANTTWRKGIQQEEIVTGSKYVVSVEGADVKLTIINVSKDDEGVYFCRSENPLIVTELEVYLTVKASSANTGAIVGSFIAALIVIVSFVVAKLVYSSRHQICLGGGFGQTGERGDVINLVDSDDEQIFQDAVPQLPPLTNGRHTTLVQIHRIPSSDHEDTDTADTCPQQQEDTVETEEPADLVSF
ncbi:V-set and immunoglobulin domain-containing protein 10 [Anabas testudineus]|uniref:Ig-like domain-containing protein n=1 Tax=Anabas testudineus TaxID=64144 RepID=A0A7N6FD45_ANATE|nr:V-set and immunoglobulin domain-containing protein 10 [Anabas testudineus]